jgi:hypothetical protein
MYDIEFFVPITSREHWKFRLLDLPNTLILNPAEWKISIKLLCGPSEGALKKEEFLASWDQRLNVEFVETPYESAPQKIFYYYNQIALDRCDDVKWFARIDDDSFTNADGLLRILTEEYDWQKPHHIGGTLKWDWHPVERALMTRLGYGHYYQMLHGHWSDVAPVHEHETGITSSTAMREVLANPIACKLLKMRETINDGWGDHCFALAAKFAGIMPYLHKTISTEGLWTKFSLLNGPFVHVHPIHSGMMPIEEWNIIKTIMDANGAINPELTGNYQFMNMEGITKKISYLSLEENGYIRNLENINIGRWTAKEDELLLFSDVPREENRLITTVLKPKNNVWVNKICRLQSE